MKYLKLSDVIIQAVITVVAMLQFNTGGIWIYYFGLGGWQVLSCLMHLVAIERSERNKSRKAYEITLAWVAGLAFISWIVIVVLKIELGDLLAVEAYLMLLIGIVMGIWYWVTCIYELATENMNTEIETN